MNSIDDFIKAYCIDGTDKTKFEFYKKELETILNNKQTKKDNVIEDDLSIDDLNEDAIKKLKIIEMKRICKQYGLKVGGVKKDLIERLVNYKNGIVDSNEPEIIVDKGIEEFNEADLRKLKVKNIKLLLKSVGLRLEGKKDILVKRALRYKNNNLEDNDRPSQKRGRKKNVNSKNAKHECCGVLPDNSQCTENGKKFNVQDQKWYCYRHIPHKYVISVDEPPQRTRIVENYNPDMTIEIPQIHDQIKNFTVTEIDYKLS